MGNLRPITQVAGGFKNTEAVMTEIVHEELRMDKEQGGFTECTGAVERVFILWTIIVFRWIVLSEATYAVFMDLASFFDTISPLLVAVYTRRCGLPKLVCKYIAKMYEYSKALVRTAAGTAASAPRRRQTIPSGSQS